jgi:hypothetical protein
MSLDTLRVRLDNLNGVQIPKRTANPRSDDTLAELVEACWSVDTHAPCVSDRRHSRPLPVKLLSVSRTRLE